MAVLTRFSGRHEQVAVKVNAWVDRGIAPLVEALAAIPGVISVESCQGGEEDTPRAYVTFRRGNGWAELGGFLAWLSGALGGQLYDCRVSLEWNNGGSAPWAEIRVTHGAESALAAAIREIAPTAPELLPTEAVATETEHLALRAGA